jgi:hypothetical protein
VAAQTKESRADPQEPQHGARRDQQQEILAFPDEAYRRLMHDHNGRGIGGDGDQSSVFGRRLTPRLDGREQQNDP